MVPLGPDSVVDLPGRWNNRVRLEGALDFVTSTVRNELPLALYQGGYVERELRERSADQMRAKNTAGFVLGARLTWTGRDCFLGQRHWRPIVSVAQQEVMGLRFTDDLFRLTFFGNAAYEDRTANVAPSAFTRIGYRSVGVGFMDQRTGSYLLLGLVQGGSFTEVDIRSASLYTAPDGRLLSLSINGEFHANDTAGNGYDRFNGLGAALSGRWAFRFGQDKYTVAAGVTDLGIVRWNGNSVHLAKDSLIDYRGIDITDLLDLDDVLIGEERLRDTFGLHYTTSAHNMLLPFRATLEFRMQLDDRTETGITIAQRNLPGHVPEAILHAGRRLGQRTLLGAHVGYGGAGGLRAGISARMRLGQHTWIDLGTAHLPGLLLGGARSMGLQAAITVGF
jgi:hypothetical protein